MKKQFLCLFVCIFFICCTDNVTFNSPALEGQKNNVFWRAVDSKATLANGVIIIDGFIRNEKLTLSLPAPSTKVDRNNKSSYITYILGTSPKQSATYVLTDSNGTTNFSTGLGIGDGQIVITGYDGVNNLVSGTFKFNAKNSNGSALAETNLNFQYGNFYIILR